MALSLTYCIIYKLCPDGNELLVSMAQDQRVIYQHIMRECVIQCAAKLAVENQSSPFPSSLREALPRAAIAENTPSWENHLLQQGVGRKQTNYRIWIQSSCLRNIFPLT